MKHRAAAARRAEAVRPLVERLAGQGLFLRTIAGHAGATT